MRRHSLAVGLEAIPISLAFSTGAVPLLAFTQSPLESPSLLQWLAVAEGVVSMSAVILANRGTNCNPLLCGGSEDRSLLGVHGKGPEFQTKRRRLFIVPV